MREVLPAGSLTSEDSFGQLRHLKRTVEPVAVCREGSVVMCSELEM